MFKNKDINKYKRKKVNASKKANFEDELAVAATATTKTVFSMVMKLILTVFIVLSIAGLVALSAVVTFILSLRDTQIQALETVILNQSSTVYLTDDEGNDDKYMIFHQNENRTWVEYKDIPENMIYAQVAIEDKRFFEHDGVDWYNTIGAAFRLLTGAEDTRGGSTITQQLVKNITQEDDVSINRKITEIFAALNLQAQYSDEEILEYYLNVVNYGSNVHGVEAAAQLYFGKSITEASLAECAMIAGITQMPYYYNPINFPDNAEEKQMTVLGEMLEQGYITRDEYEEAKLESENMNYVFTKSETGTTEDEEVLDSNSVWNWYIEEMRNDIIRDLQEELNVSAGTAENMLFNGGLQIYCAMDLEVQEGIENVVVNADDILGDPMIEIGFYYMDYDGRTIAVVGSRYEKTGNLVLNHATQTTRQPGSSIKPLSVYSLGIESGVINYSSMVDDNPLPDYYGPGEPGPQNYVKWDYRGYMSVATAIATSQNAPSAQVLELIGVDASFNYLIDRFNISTLDNTDDRTKSAMATGGTYNGVTVEEMTAAFQVFGNQGEYNEPYTYYYVTDADGKILLDNRDNQPEKAMSAVNASIMNKLLQYVMTNGTGIATKIPGVTIYGKTGTTDDIHDIWFVNGTPYGVSGIWSGYSKEPDTLPTQGHHRTLWSAIMEYMQETHWVNEEPKYFEYSDEMISARYCTDSGYLAGDNCPHTQTGWYSSASLPRTCNSNTDHSQYRNDPTTPEPSPTPTPIAQPPVPTAPPEEPEPNPEPDSSNSDPEEESSDSTSSTSEPAEVNEDTPWFFW